MTKGLILRQPSQAKTGLMLAVLGFAFFENHIGGPL
jgi:hypothetical protein